MENKNMRYLFLVFFIFLVGCQKEELTPVGKEYQLVNFDSPVPITLGFNPDGRFYGKVLNDYWGQYHIHDATISFSGITNTMKSGTKPQRRAEKEYFDSLTNGHTFEIKEEELKIFFDEKGVLIFQQLKEN